MPQPSIDRRGMAPGVEGVPLVDQQRMAAVLQVLHQVLLEGFGVLVEQRLDVGGGAAGGSSRPVTAAR